MINIILVSLVVITLLQLIVYIQTTQKFKEALRIFGIVNCFAAMIFTIILIRQIRPYRYDIYRYVYVVLFLFLINVSLILYAHVEARGRKRRLITYVLSFILVYLILGAAINELANIMHQTNRFQYIYKFYTFTEQEYFRSFLFLSTIPFSFLPLLLAFVLYKKKYFEMWHVKILTILPLAYITFLIVMTNSFQMFSAYIGQAGGGGTARGQDPLADATQTIGAIFTSILQSPTIGITVPLMAFAVFPLVFGDQIPSIQWAGNALLVFVPVFTMISAILGFSMPPADILAIFGSNMEWMAQVFYWIVMLFVYTLTIIVVTGFTSMVR